MFTLNDGLARWRRQMAAKGIRNRELLDELESHIREEVDCLMKRGQTERCAFETAVERIGPPEALHAEFRKLNPPGSSGKIERLCCYIFPALMLLINAWTLFIYELSGPQRALGLCVVLAICLCLVWLPRLLQSLTPPAYQRLVMAIKLMSSLVWLVPVWSLLEAEHIFHWEIGIVPTVVLWCFFGAIAVAAFCYGVNARFRPGGRGSGGPTPPCGYSGQPIPPTSPRPPRFDTARARIPSAS